MLTVVDGRHDHLRERELCHDAGVGDRGQGKADRRTWMVGTRGRGDPWAVAYRKDFPEEASDDPEAELRDVMGEYWVSADEIRVLLARS